jgi:predicted O-methyltransferase YrrM
LAQREKSGNNYLQEFPGEHYKLIAGICKVLQPKTAIEIGTYLGHASLVMKSFIPLEGQVVTFDIFPWNYFDSSCLQKSDFEDGRLTQLCVDLTDWNQAEKHKDIIEAADFIFIDALKDGVQEKKFIENFSKLRLKDSCILMFDDIRLWNMLAIWRNLNRPKMDLTSFGHWSGTGLVHWNG